MPGVSRAQVDESAMSQEYFIQQAEDEALLIRIDPFEAEFESTISGQVGNTILVSAIPGSRIVPLFQYINPQSKPRQLNIAVSSRLNTNRSDFSLALTRIAIWDDRSNSVAQALQLLSFGLEASTDESAANWTVKIDSLINAGRSFEQFGMKEMRLWSNYFAAHLILFHLHDHSIVYSMSREILAEVKDTRLDKIELAALRLQSEALIGLKRSGSISASADDTDPVQSALENTARLAESMGFYFEMAQAFNVSGAEFMAESAYAKALVQYQRAVEIADMVGDAEFATGIRESIVDIHAIQGNLTASSAVLQEIESQLQDEGGDELALNLLAQGRLFIRSYQFLQAYEILSQAMIQQNDSAIRRQVNFALAKVFYATGRLERSKSYLQLANISIETSEDNRGNTAIDIGEGLRLLANIYRSNGEFDLMQKARLAQGRYQPASAFFLYESGLDVLAPANGNKSKAQSLFSQSRKAALSTGYQDLSHLALLQVCALGKSQNTQHSCEMPTLRNSFNWLESGGVPAQSVEAMYLWARILILNGRRSDALAVLDRAVTDIHFYRYALPGVLGSWYGQRSEDLFDYYLGMMVRNTAAGISTDGKASLLALSKIRFAAKYSESDSELEGQARNNDLLRIQLGERASSTSLQVMNSLSENINRELDGLRPSFKAEFDFLTSTGMQKYLRKLNSDEVMLTYHISQTKAQVWVGNKNGVQQRSISNADTLYAELQKTRQGMADIGVSVFLNTMSMLGNRLISPVADLLTETIYFVPAGSLMGLPIDALRVDGHYLLENHIIVNSTAIPSNIEPAKGLIIDSPENVFIAGHPQDYSSNYLSHLDTSTEISAVADLFVGPGLNIVQGTALLPDEFESEQLKSAELVHLSMPGVINLKYPEQSNLELSGDENQLERASIGPSDIRQQPLSAKLVYLSTTRTQDYSESNFNNQPALITDFQRAGAKAVIANMWGSNGRAAEALVTRFYSRLLETKDISGALRDAKLQYLRTQESNGLYDWAGIQLFIE